MSEAEAWLLELGSDLRAAVGLWELIHLIPDPPKLFEIPRCPPYCSRVFLWQEEILPLMDLQTRLLHQPVQPVPKLIAILGYGEEGQLGALTLRTPPLRIRVRDEQACALPEEQVHWQRFTLACFLHEDYGAVPILDLQGLFASP